MSMRRWLLPAINAFLLAIVVCFVVYYADWEHRSYWQVRRRVLDASKNAGFKPMLVYLDNVIDKGKPFPWQKGSRIHYILLPAHPSGTLFRGLAFDKQRSLYVSGGNNVWRIRRSGEIEPLIDKAFRYSGDNPHKDGSRAICGVDDFAIDDDGSVLWVGSDHVLYIVRNGEPKPIAGKRPRSGENSDEIRPGRGEEARIPYIRRIVSAGGGKVLVVCANAICECDMDGNFRSVAGCEQGGHKDGIAEEALFQWPQVAPHPDGGFWIVDGGWGASLRLLRDGKVSTIVAGSGLTTNPPPREQGWPAPQAGFNDAHVAVLGPDKMLYVTEHESVVTADPTGKLTPLMGSRRQPIDRSWIIEGLAVDEDGNLFTTHYDAY